MFCPNCGGQNAETANNCATCGHALRQATSGMRQEGDLLVIPQGAVLPMFCVKCGQPAEGTLKKTFAWHSPLLYLLILVNILVYAIVAMVVSKKLKLEVPLCAEHRGKRKLYLGLGWGLLLGCIPAGIVVGSMGADMEGIGFLLGLVMFIASLVFFILGARTMVAKVIDDREGRFAGVSPAFIQIAVAQSRATVAR